MEEIFDSLLNAFKKEFPWSSDPDGRRRGCTVNNMARTIGGGFAEHWVLHFDWGDYEATYEANDQDGYLIPKWNRGPPEQCLSLEWRLIEQFKTNCSPSEVNTKARSISDNGNTYILTRRNCHTWAIELAAKLGISLKHAIEKHLPKNVCDAIDLGHCVNNLFGGTFASLSSSLQNGEQSTSASNSEILTPGRLATAATSCFRNREALALSSRVVEGCSRSSGANSRTATTNQEASGEAASMVATGLAMLASFAFSSFLENLEDTQTRTTTRNN